VCSVSAIRDRYMDIEEAGKERLHAFEMKYYRRILKINCS